MHVTRFNAVYWDCGRSPVRVVEHGIPDPGARWTGDIPRAAVVINDPLRRGRTTGTDLLPGFAAAAPLDVFGMGVSGLAAALQLNQDSAASSRTCPRTGCTLNWPAAGCTCTRCAGPR